MATGEKAAGDGKCSWAKDQLFSTSRRVIEVTTNESDLVVSTSKGYLGNWHLECLQVTNFKVMCNEKIDSSVYAA